MAVFAEMERDLISERTVAGLTAAKARGKQLGRPSVPDEKVQIKNFPNKLRKCPLI
ncbi:recombinase family protein [Peribacillus butanolivorans]